MMRTLFSGILGLRAHQSEMDVIGNNVANVNTFGFKRGRTVFQDILSQTVGFSTAPTGVRGGINAEQIGLGVRLAAVDNIFTQGALQSTGRSNDVAIQGDGFFVVHDGEKQLYTRAGTFDVDAFANLIHAGTGNKLMGWSSQEDPFTKDITVNTTQPISVINIKDREKLSARATTNVEYRSNLTATADERSLPETRTLSFVDDAGNKQEVEFRFLKIDKNNWNWIAIDDTEGQVGNGVLTFDDNGKITSSTGGPLLSFDPDGASGSPPSLTLQDNNTAGITNATFRPLVASTWAMDYALTTDDGTGGPDSAIPVTTDRVRLTQLANVTATDPAERFNMTSLTGDGTEYFLLNGQDGNGEIITNKIFTVRSDSTIRDLTQFIDQSFPNCIASFNPNSGRIELRDASPGISNTPRLSIQLVKTDLPPGNPAGLKFPGVNAVQAPVSDVAGINEFGFVENLLGTGTVKDGVHSITVSRVDATPSTVEGSVTGLTRFTTFAELDIGDTANFAIAVDGAPPQTVFGLQPGTYARFEGNQIPDLPASGGQYTGGNVTVNGFIVSWQDTTTNAGGTQVQNMTRDEFGRFLADRINTQMEAILASAPDQSVFANYDVIGQRLILTQRNRGQSFTININATTPPNNSPIGLSATAPIARGTDGSTIGDVIDAVNNQIPGAKLLIQGDRLVLERALDGAQFNIAISDALGAPAIIPSVGGPGYNSDTGFTPSGWSISQRIFGSEAPLTTPGTDQTYTLIDLFTPTDGSGTVQLTYNDFIPGQTIGNEDVGQIILESTGLQPGTCTITTKGEEDAGTVRVNVPTVNAYSAQFTLQTGGTPVTNITVGVIPGEKHVASTTIYDSLGNPHIVNMSFEKVSPNRWQFATSLDINDELIQRYFEANPPAGDAPTELELAFANDSVLTNRRGMLIFNEFGKVDTDATSAANAVNLPDLVPKISFEPLDAKKVEFMPDFNAVTQFDAGFSTAARYQDGYEMGMLQEFEITGSGVIVGSYTNGFKRDIGQVALATFVNPAGLEKEGDSMYSQAANSGLPLIGAAGTGGRGTMQSQTLEMSNVDLAQEFTDMIIAQRGFQANARSITTADQFLQELMNLKR